MCYQFPLRLQNVGAGGRGLLPPQELQTSLLWRDCGEGAFQPAAASAEMAGGSSQGVPLPLQLQPALGGWNQSSPARLAAGGPEPPGLTLQLPDCAEDSRHVPCLAVSWVLSGVLAQEATASWRPWSPGPRQGHSCFTCLGDRKQDSYKAAFSSPEVPGGKS